jgi:hypothetical protein
VAQPHRQLFQHLGGLLAVQVDQQRGEDLRVLVADQLHHLAGLQVVEALDAAVRLVGLQDVLEQVAGAVVTQRLAQHRADVAAGAQVQGGELLGLEAEFREDGR